MESRREKQIKIHITLLTGLLKIACEALETAEGPMPITATAIRTAVTNSENLLDIHYPT